MFLFPAMGDFKSRKKDVDNLFNKYEPIATLFALRYSLISWDSSGFFLVFYPSKNIKVLLKFAHVSESSFKFSEGPIIPSQIFNKQKRKKKRNLN